jgi:hypothetical protein
VPRATPAPLRRWLLLIRSPRGSSRLWTPLYPYRATTVRTYAYRALFKLNLPIIGGSRTNDSIDETTTGDLKFKLVVLWHAVVQRMN